ncbi:hypothetical protein [Actinomadura harenae]|uniref:Uncharacterized protein n=1 Tax=Actinomadura harenae TaxID=2483351 RepID=A0A3M2MA91_9ACTN|nr:hypothetical protein [Actinomadura harenae]RMI46401.1 hypothetical protein EBO15_07560 [Actinomadura harenae]
MAETPSGPPAAGGGRPGRGGARRGGRTHPQAWQRSFRCRRAVRPADRPAARYADFVALHDSFEEADVAARKLWLIGLGSAVVTGILAFGSAYVIRTMSGVPVPSFVDRSLSPTAAGTAYAICSAAVTLQLTALVQILLATARRPVRAFLWSGGVLVLLITALPLLVGGPVQATAATALLDLCGGVAVVAVSAAAAAAIGPQPLFEP